VPFVTLFRGDPIYQQLATAFSEHGAHWNVTAETEFFSTACELVAAGCGVGIVDPVVSRPFTENVVLVPFEPNIEYQIAILLPTREELSQVAAEFIEVLRPHLQA
jgi:DNA-binding transcriptional LysR family regulator